MKKYYVSEVIDDLGVTKYTWKIFFLIGMAMVFDGFDNFIVAFTMPQISQEWALTKVQTGSLSSWGLFGLVIGSIVAGIISDHIGRKKALILSCIVYSFFNLIIYFAQNFETFAILRVMAGIGLGACMPVSSTMCSEFVPTKQRGVFVTSLYALLATGSVLAGIVAMLVVPVLGWRFCYLFGGIPVLWAFVLATWLPDSPHWLVSKGRGKEAVSLIQDIARSAERLDAEWTPESLDVPPPPKSVGVKALFSSEYRLATAGLWFVYFLGTLMLYGAGNWMPTLLYTTKGFSIKASYALSTLQSAAVVIASVASGWISDKIGRRRNVILGYTLTILVLVWVAFATGQWQIGVSVILLGFVSNLGLTTMQPLLAETYRTEFRNTGVAFAQGIGRFGGAFGPIMAGWVQ